LKLDLPNISPVFQERDQVRRFITLIDALYESHAKVVCTAALDPISLFPWRFENFPSEQKSTRIQNHWCFALFFCDMLVYKVPVFDREIADDDK